MRGKEEKYFCPECAFKGDGGGSCPRCGEGLEEIKGESYSSAEDMDTPMPAEKMYFDDDPDALTGYGDEFNTMLD
ncbi:MAG: hypothetical protein WCG48_00910 [Candidatus Berkelbacteria bacterium]